MLSPFLTNFLRTPDDQGSPTDGSAAPTPRADTPFPDGPPDAGSFTPDKAVIDAVAASLAEGVPRIPSPEGGGAVQAMEKEAATRSLGDVTRIPSRAVGAPAAAAGSPQDINDTSLSRQQRKSLLRTANDLSLAEARRKTIRRKPVQIVGGRMSGARRVELGTLTVIWNGAVLIITRISDLQSIVAPIPDVDDSITPTTADAARKMLDAAAIMLNELQTA